MLAGYLLITVGGAVAMNIHGKNQFHLDNFGDHVTRSSLYHPKKDEITCDRKTNSDIFRLTVGGFGPTGHVTSIDIAVTQLTGRCAVVQSYPVPNLTDAGYVMEKLSETSDYAYSWHNLSLSGKRFGSGMVYAESLTCASSKPRTLAERVTCTAAWYGVLR